MHISTMPELADTKVWRLRTLWLIIGLGCFRILLASAVPLDLIHDEAYYWDWSRQLDWGYYSKPPLVAWLIALSTWVGGTSVFFVRLPAVLLGTGGLVWMYLLAARLYGRRAGFWAVLISAVTPGNSVLSLLMTIDAPLLFCWGGALYGFWRLLERDAKRLPWLLLAVGAVGLGLLAKQTMFGFLALGAFFLASSREDRPRLWRPLFWIWVVGSLLFLTPVLWWNSQHGWITVQHTGGHFASESIGLFKRLAFSGEFVGSQFGVVSPVTCFLLWSVMAAALRAFFRLGRKERYLLCFSALPMAGVLVLSLTQRIEPNWPAAFYPSAVVLLAACGTGGVQLKVWPRIRPNDLLRAVVVGIVFVSAMYLFVFGMGLQGSKLDIAVRLRGWHRLGESVALRRAELPRLQKTFVLVTAGRAVASELAFYLPDQPRVFLWTPGPKIDSQYDLWGGPKGMRGWDALIVTAPHTQFPSALAAAFERIEDRGLVDVPIGADRRHTYRIWHGAGFRAWPSPKGASP